MKCMYCGNELSTGDIGFMCQTCRYGFPELKPKETSLLYGWICPRCQKVHNWMVRHCDCPPYVITASTTEPKELAEIQGTDELAEKIANTDYMDTEQTCYNCNYSELSYRRYPCNNCEDGEKWEPIKTE